jgi:hypothetical protein
LNAESALALLIVALYLKDNALLLNADEAVLVPSVFGRRRWRAGFGARGFTIARREPYLANPLLPHQPVYRLRWQMTQAAHPGAARSANPATEMLAVNPLLWRLAPLVWGMWLATLVLLPLTLLGRWGVVATLATVMLLYAHIVLALGLVWWWRARLGLTGRAFAMLAFECLACAPYAVNLVRRLAWVRSPHPEDFTAAAARLLDGAAQAEVRAECLARIDEQLQAEPEGSAAAAALLRARERFAAEAAAAATAPAGPR